MYSYIKDTNKIINKKINNLIILFWLWIIIAIVIDCQPYYQEIGVEFYKKLVNNNEPEIQLRMKEVLQDLPNGK